MNREEATKLLPIIKAFSEGETIQVKDKRLSDEEDSWSETDDCSFNIEKFDYRIKPNSKPESNTDVNYRPFSNGEECMKEMHKHEPFSLVINKSNDREYNIQSIFIKNDILYIRGSHIGLVRAFNDYTFADGTPFGVKMEE